MAGFEKCDPFPSSNFWSKFSHDELDLLLEGGSKSIPQQISKFQKTKDDLLMAFF